MAAFPPIGQPERPEIVRRQQIAAIADPKERGELQALVKERDAAVKANSAALDKNFDANREAKTKTLVDKAYANAPDAPKEYQAKGGYLQATQDAKASVVENKLLNNEAVARGFNKQIDPRLDKIYGPYVPDPKHERRLNDFDKAKTTLAFKPPDPDRSR